jgi:hypothetical protein
LAPFWAGVRRSKVACWVDCNPLKGHAPLLWREALKGPLDIGVGSYPLYLYTFAPMHPCTLSPPYIHTPHTTPDPLIRTTSLIRITSLTRITSRRRVSLHGCLDAAREAVEGTAQAH